MRLFTAPAWTALAGILFAATAVARAQPLYVPNASFETPSTAFVDNRLERWQRTPKPFWYDESGGFTWDQLFGTFKNTDPGKPDHIANCDGAQAIYLFAVPEAGLFQDRVGAGATFAVGKSYSLTTGVIGGGGGMTNGVSLEMSLYYLDAGGNRVVVGATNIVHDPARFPNQTNLVDIKLTVPPVRPTDAWSGKPIGIRFLSTVNPALAGGYWDLDNVRLTESIEVPNASFESPVTAFVDNRVDFWQKTPKPVWYDESGGFTWDQLTGVFKNTEPGKDDHLENADGAQAFYMFAVPGVGISLDEGATNTVAPGGVAPLLARYEPGKSYSVTIAVQGGGGGMTNGVTLQLSLYYRDDSGAPQALATTVVTNEAARFPSRHLLTDFEVRTAPVKSTDPWAGKGIGVQILSTVDPVLAGGYWNLDHARLQTHPEPALLSPGVANGRFGFVLQSEPGALFSVLVSDNATATASGWTAAGTITNATGFAEFSETAASVAQRFYRVQQLP